MICELAKYFIRWVKRIFVTQAVIGTFTGKLSESEDLTTAVKQFVDNFQAENRVKIRSFSVTDDVAKEDTHEFSGIVRMEFKYKIGRKKKSEKVILKVPSLAPMYFLYLIIFPMMFSREVHVYKTILPELYRLGECEPFAPKLYTATETNVLVLEDLSVDGFIPRDQAIWLDLDECWITLEILATYHALSYKYLQSLSKNDASRSLIELTPIGRESIETISEFYEIIKPQLSQQLDQKILQLKDELQTTDPLTCLYPQENSMIVLIHGDFRTGNILFKYDNNDLTCDAKIIDWQLTREASPVSELIYFFITSISIETIETHGNALIDFYLKKLNNKLTSLNIDRSYGKPELDADMIYYKHEYFDSVCGLFKKMIDQAEPGIRKDSYISSAERWLNYLNKNKII